MLLAIQFDELDRGDLSSGGLAVDDIARLYLVDDVDLGDAVLAGKSLDRLLQLELLASQLLILTTQSADFARGEQPDGARTGGNNRHTDHPLNETHGALPGETAPRPGSGTLVPARLPTYTM